MDIPLFINDSVWTTEHYKNALRMTQGILRREQIPFDAITEHRIKVLPLENLQKFIKAIKNKEFRLLPFRVHGQAKNQAEFQLFSSRDMRMHSFTLYSKHAFATLFIFEMSETKIQKEPFIQVAIERLYSHKKGYGFKLLQQLMKKAKQHNISLTLWCENDKLRDYFVANGFDCRFKSLTTGHYFMTYQV